MLTSRFDRSAIPPILAFLQAHFDRVPRPSRGRVMVRCNFPDHQDKTPSMAWNLDTGKFRCFGCGRHGDAIDYLMIQRGLDFKRAAQSVGAWRDHDLTALERAEIRRAEAERQRRRDEQAAQEERQRQERLAVRAEVHRDTALMRDISALLSCDLENEELWDCLRVAWQSRELSERQYAQLAGLECER